MLRGPLKLPEEAGGSCAVVSKWDIPGESPKDENVPRSPSVPAAQLEVICVDTHDVFCDCNYDEYTESYG